MQTGITISDDCVTEFTQLRMKRAHRFLILKANEEKTQIVIEHIG